MFLECWENCQQQVLVSTLGFSFPKKQWKKLGQSLPKYNPLHFTHHHCNTLPIQVQQTPKKWHTNWEFWWG
jgi:hypothetical protein